MSSKPPAWAIQGAQANEIFPLFVTKLIQDLCGPFVEKKGLNEFRDWPARADSSNLDSFGRRGDLVGTHLAYRDRGGVRCDRCDAGIFFDRRSPRISSLPALDLPRGRRNLRPAMACVAHGEH